MKRLGFEGRATVCRLGCVVALVGWLWTAPGLAGPYSGLVIFGDSLTDTGNWAKKANMLPLPYPYSQGRISDGPVWVEFLATKLGLPAPKASLLGGFNYAWAGGTTGSVKGEDVNMDVQLANYLASHQPKSDELFVVWCGVNDFLMGQTDVQKPVDLLISHLNQLTDRGAANFLIVNLPRYLGTDPGSAGLRKHAANFNRSLAESLGQFRHAHGQVTIHEFDYYGFFESVVAKPTAYGFLDMVNPATNNGPYLPGYRQHYFLDSTHPTSRAHKFIAEAAYAALLPEPVVSWPLASLLVLAFARRRPGRAGHGP